MHRPLPSCANCARSRFRFSGLSSTARLAVLMRSLAAPGAVDALDRLRPTALRTEKLAEEEQAAPYFDLLQDTKRYVEAALLAAEFLDRVQDPAAHLLGVSLRTQAEHALCIIDQTERRILLGQKVTATPASGSRCSRRASMSCASATRWLWPQGLERAGHRGAAGDGARLLSALQPASRTDSLPRRGTGELRTEEGLQSPPRVPNALISRRARFQNRLPFTRPGSPCGFGTGFLDWN